MPKRRSSEEIQKLIEKADHLIQSGQSVKDALKEVGVASGCYYRIKRRRKKNKTPELLTLETSLPSGDFVLIAMGKGELVQKIVQDLVTYGKS